MFSSWQPRYFRLSNGTLSYFATPDDKVAKDKVVIDETCTCRPAGDKYKKKFCFEVCSWRGPLAVCAECEEDCELWKDYITKTVKAIQQLAAQKGIKRGLLYKRDEGLFRKWKQKWVVLNRTNLSFYETPDDPSRQKPPTDELDLVDADINATDVIIDGRSFCFIIRQPKRQSIELSTSDNSSMNDWMKMLQSNINGVQEHAVSSKKASWGVRPKRARLQKTGAGWFQSGRVQEVTVIESRQTRIDGEKTTEYFLHVQHKTGLAWCISRQLQDILDLHATFNNTDPKKYEFLDTFIQGPRDNKAKKLTTAERAQTHKLIRLYMEEALKQAATVEFAAIEQLVCPTVKGFDEHRGHLMVARQAGCGSKALKRWCVLSSSENCFSWGEQDDSTPLQVSLARAILVVKVSSHCRYCSLTRPPEYSLIH
jgi:DNA-binding phage protein